MKYNDIILLLLLLTFVLLSMYYIGCVCEFKLTGVTGVTGATGVTGVKEAFTGFVGDTSCMLTTLTPIIKTCETCKNMTTTYDGLKGGEVGDYNYHTDYTCANITNPPTQYSIDDIPYKFDIRNKNLLLAYKCVKLSPRDLEKQLRAKRNPNDDVNIEMVLNEPLINEYSFNNIGTGPGTGLNNANIRGQINEKIKNMLLTANKTQGPIYACISQAPYLKGQKARFDIVQHGKGCYDNGRACGDTRLLKFEILLVFLEGNNAKINKFIEIVTANSSRNALCFLNCGGIDDKDNLSMGCGCLNKNSSYTNDDGSSYNSVCLAPDSDFLQSTAMTNTAMTNTAVTNKTANYSIIYFLNPHNNNGVTISHWTTPVMATPARI
jgi:hypothetical protein